MKTTWFRKKGIFFVPISIVGIFLYLFTIAFCINVFLAVDRNSHSNSDTLYGVFPFFVSAFTILYCIEYL
jgi:hypothetical protein